MKIRLLWLACFYMATLSSAGRNSDGRSDSIRIINTFLAVDISNFSERVIYGHAALSIAAKVENVRYINLDLLELEVDSLKFNGKPIRYSYNGSGISINFPRALIKDVPQTIDIYYRGTPIQIPGDFGGFFWDDYYAFNIGVSFLSVPHNFGKSWFPCFDNFVTRSSFRFAVTTDASRKALCNGNLDSVLTLSNGNLVWYWTMNHPIPAYLASISVSDYVILKDSCKGINGVLPIWLAARASDTLNLRKSFVHLKDAITIFEGLFGPYPFNRVGYCVVPFTAGAMEHATNISYMEGIVNGDITYENVMAHELSHQWFGDLVTIEDEGDMWMQEGFASYCEYLFYEGLYGEEFFRHEVRIKHEDVLRMAHVVDSSYWAVSGLPPNLTYSNYSVYELGADRIHCLRAYLGDSLFFSCLKSYLQTYQDHPVNSYMLRDYLRNCSGRINITDFFNDWVFSGGFPDFSIESKKVRQIGKYFQVSLLIRQRGNHTTHLFQHVPLEIAFFDSLGNRLNTVTDIVGKCNSSFYVLPFYPTYTALDFDEKLGSAVTALALKLVGSNQKVGFDLARLNLFLHKSSDTSLVRVALHFVAPEVSKKNNPVGLRLSDYRYWSVDGLWSPDFSASAAFQYNGSTHPQGFLDNSLLAHGEDSLTLVYREDASSNWTIVPDITIKREGSSKDKTGAILVKKLMKGQYALAVFDAAYKSFPNDTNCSLNDETSDSSFILSPVLGQPGQMFISILQKDNFKKCLMKNDKGDLVMNRDLRTGEDNFIFSMNGLPAGVYTLDLIGDNQKKISKIIQKKD